ncbi:MAG: DUF2807 domain-containing protein [Crocinitomicaceae bacterium]|nr:DUF2807 domain-containing protein [Crocinitomicaceae bacterium]
MKYFLVILSISLLIFSCKKSSERTCFKSYGDDSQIEFALDSVDRFKLYKNIRYHIYQDTLRKVIIKGGKNVISLIELSYNSTALSITNKNKCNFLRDFDNQILVEIHYPFYKWIYSETDDSLVFKDTIQSDYLYVDQFLGGGKVILNTQADVLIMNASNGVGSYTLGGHADYANLRVQAGASGDATQLTSFSYLLDQNSTGDLKVNLDSAAANIAIKGTGNVIYSGDPDTIILTKTGDGELIQE